MKIEKETTYEKVTKLIMGKLKKYKVISQKELETLWKDCCKELCLTDSLIEKGCPKNAFLGCLKVNDLGLNIEWKNEKVGKNQKYSILALEILEKNGDIYSFKELWREIGNGEKKHNSQMNVALTFWRSIYKNMKK